MNLGGATENARLELSAPSKMQGWKMRDQAAMESQNILYILVYNTQVALDAVRDSVVSSLGGG